MMVRVIAFILFIPHILLFLSSENRTMIIADLYSRSHYKKQNLLSVLFDLAVRLLNDRYFRTLFYFRTTGPVSKLLRVFYPRDRYFIVDININLGKGVQLAHPYSTILNAESIGDNLYINHLVTVGEKNGKKPVIGNNVQLHAASMIIGDVKIGNNVIVGAGAVVVKDIPDNCLVVGNPARIIQR